MSNERDHRRDVQMLLQQLSIGLSAYRLFPGDLEQQAFLGAVERIRGAAERALKHGTVLVEIHGARFRMEDDEPFPEDEALSRLARACFDRRGERLRIRANPEAHELGPFYEALTGTPESIEEAGGLDKMLRNAGVSSIAVSEVELRPMDASMIEGLSADQAQLWEQLQHGDTVAPMFEEDGETDHEAQSIYARFRELLEALPEELADDPDLYRRLHRSVEELPPEIRRALMSRMIETVDQDSMSDRMLTSMTDGEMARVLMELADSSKRDPVALARDIVAKGVRRNDTVVKMTADLVKGRAKEKPKGKGTPMSAPSMPMSLGKLPMPEPPTDVKLPAPQAPMKSGRQAVVSQAVSDILSQELRDLERGDLDAIRGDFPFSQTEYRVLAVATLRDYLPSEHDMDRLETVLEIWSMAVRERLLKADTDGAAELVDLVRSATSGDEERNELATTYLRRVLDAGLVASLTTEGHDSAALQRLLAPLGPSAVDGLLDALGAEQNRARRALLIAVLTELSRDYRDLVIERLEDPRWFVARNAVTILHRAGVTRSDLPWLERALKHDHPGVRREAIEPVTVALGPDSVPYLSRLASDSDMTVADLAIATLGALVSPRAVPALVQAARSSHDWNLRRRAVESLGRQSAPGAAQALEMLRSWRSQPRLPRSLRRVAKKLLKERGRTE